MRIIAGSLKGRKLALPEDDSIRPTMDRTREAIFNLLMHGAYAGEAIREAHVLDLCCGTGAMGLEAISRGARTVTFVDQSKKSLSLAQQNALHCGVLQQCHFVHSDVRSLSRARKPVSLAFFDAPYAANLLAATYDALVKGGWLQPQALLVAELPASQELPALPEATHIDARRYGKADIHIWRAA